MKKRWWIIGAVIVGIAGITGYRFTAGNQPAGQPVQLIKVEPAHLQSKVMATGKVKVKDPFTHYAGTDGFLRGFTLRAGDQVRQGQVIGQIDMSDMSNRLLELDAQIELKRADLAKARLGEEPEEIAQQQERVAAEERARDLAQREYDRTLSLFQSGASTQQEVDKAKDVLQNAITNLNIAKQNLALKQKGPRPEELHSIEAQINQLIAEKNQLEKDRVHSVIKAPFDGTVLTVAAENGQYVTRGRELLTIGNLQQLIVESAVSESDAPKLEVNQTATIEDSSLGKQPLKAKVARISPIAETIESSQGNKTRVNVTLDLLETAPKLKPGYQVDVNILVQDVPNSLQVPIEVVQQDENGSPFVWIAENGLAKKRSVELGLENELFYEIKGGLAAGESIIQSPSESLRENAPIIEKPQATAH